MIKFFTSDR